MKQFTHGKLTKTLRKRNLKLKHIEMCSERKYGAGLGRHKLHEIGRGSDVGNRALPYLMI